MNHCRSESPGGSELLARLPIRAGSRGCFCATAPTVRCRPRAKSRPSSSLPQPVPEVASAIAGAAGATKRRVGGGQAISVHTVKEWAIPVGIVGAADAEDVTVSFLGTL